MNVFETLDENAVHTKLQPSGYKYVGSHNRLLSQPSSVTPLCIPLQRDFSRSEMYTSF